MPPPGVLQPYSSVLFEWAHAPAADSADLRCRSAAACAALDAAVANGTAPPPPDGSLPCGWAAAQQLPCLSPIVYTWVGVVSSATLAGGTALYATYFQTWSYRSILATSQAAIPPSPWHPLRPSCHPLAAPSSRRRPSSSSTCSTTSSSRDSTSGEWAPRRPPSSASEVDLTGLKTRLCRFGVSDVAFTFGDEVLEPL